MRDMSFRLGLKESFSLNGEKDLFNKNRAAVNDFLNSLIRAMTLVLLAIMGIMTLVSFSFNYVGPYKKVYLFFLFLDCFVAVFTRVFKKFSERHPLVFIYFFFVGFLAFTLCANFSSRELKEYVSAICAVFIIPVLILDRSYRVNIFTGLAYAVCLWLSYKCKGLEMFKNDIVNLTMWYIAGIFVGKSIRVSRLRGFDTERILTIERNTDSLTKLANRRKLFEYLRRGNESALMRPTGMFMIDIDKFKQYNDHYGHRAGDICLGIIGKCFEDFGQKNKLKFFRYGGEEFCALCWTKDYMELAACAEDLLQAVRDLKILFNIDGTASGVVTISLGYAAFDRDDGEYNFENMIKVTDAALYSAKSHGRNCARGA